MSCLTHTSVFFSWVWWCNKPTFATNHSRWTIMCQTTRLLTGKVRSWQVQFHLSHVIPASHHLRSQVESSGATYIRWFLQFWRYLIWNMMIVIIKQVWLVALSSYLDELRGLKRFRESLWLTCKSLTCQSRFLCPRFSADTGALWARSQNAKSS